VLATERKVKYPRRHHPADRMEFRKIASAFSIVIGIMMAAMWTVFALTDQIPELDTSPKEIYFHLAAEFLTAIALIAGGLGLLMKRGWGYPVYMVSLGLLAYTVVVSPGYYAQREEYAFVGMFAVLMALDLLFIALSIRKRDELAGAAEARR